MYFFFHTPKNVYIYVAYRIIKDTHAIAMGYISRNEICASQTKRVRILKSFKATTSEWYSLVATSFAFKILFPTSPAHNYGGTNP